MKLKVPKELKDITLEQTQKVLLISENPDIEDFAKMVHSVAIMTGRTPQEIASVYLVDLENVYNRIFSMIEGGGLEAPLRRHVNYLGRDYAFIEDVREMETGAFVDIDEMTKADKYAANLHKIMAVLYRPVDAKIGNRYRLKSYVKEDPKDREERQAIFLKHMTLDVVRGAAGFFLAVMLKSCGISNNSFPLQMVRKEVKTILGDGITSYTP